MDLLEHRLDSKVIYDGVIVRLEVDHARLPDGSVAIREVVRHPGGVGILALDENGNVPLVRQFRYPFQELLLEIPAGKLEPGEDHRLAAARELSEETGYEADQLTYLGSCLASPGFSTERLHMYLAQGLHRREQHPDADEFLAVEMMPFSRLVEQVMDGTLVDAKTVTTVLKTKVLLGL